MIITRLNIRKIENINKPIFIYGIGGGFGNIGKIVGRKIIKNYNGKLIGKIYVFGGFMDYIYIDKNGKMIDIFSYSLYHFNYKEKDFIVISGKLQPVIIENPLSDLVIMHRYMLSREIVRIARKLNAEEFIIIGGYGASDIEPEDPSIHIIYNAYFDKNKIENINANMKIEKLVNSTIYATPAILFYMLSLYKIPTLALFGQTYPTPEINGYIASSKILELLNHLYGFEIDTKKLYEKGMKVREDILKLKEKREELIRKKIDEEQKRENFYFG